MKVPVICTIVALVTTFGGHGPYWYQNLTKEEREEADRLACQYANRVFYREHHELSQPEQTLVADMVKPHFR